MVDVKKLSRAGDDLMMNCKLMGAYSMPIFMRPDELRDALTLLDWETTSYLPEMLIKGTRGEEQIREIGKILSATTSDNLKLLFGDNVSDKLRVAGKAMGTTTIEGLFETLLLLLQIVLENKETKK